VVGPNCNPEAVYLDRGFVVFLIHRGNPRL
jgi:hypothetical protein